MQDKKYKTESVRKNLRQKLDHKKLRQKLKDKKFKKKTR